MLYDARLIEDNVRANMDRYRCAQGTTRLAAFQSSCMTGRRTECL